MKDTVLVRELISLQSLGPSHYPVTSPSELTTPLHSPSRCKSPIEVCTHQSLTIPFLDTVNFRIDVPNISQTLFPIPSVRTNHSPGYNASRCTDYKSLSRRSFQTLSPPAFLLLLYYMSSFLHCLRSSPFPQLHHSGGIT
jgi:hypothetical protein